MKVLECSLDFEIGSILKGFTQGSSWLDFNISKTNLTFMTFTIEWYSVKMQSVSSYNYPILGKYMCCFLCTNSWVDTWQLCDNSLDTGVSKVTWHCLWPPIIGYVANSVWPSYNLVLLKINRRWKYMPITTGVFDPESSSTCDRLQRKTALPGRKKSSLRQSENSWYLSVRVFSQVVNTISMC